MRNLLAHLLILGLPGATVFVLICSLARLRRIWLGVAAGAATTLLVYLLSIHRCGDAVAQVYIEEPSPSSSLVTAGALLMVQGRVSPPDARVYVLVHPSQDPYWWVQEEAKKGIQGSWHSEVSLGSPDNGKRTHFQLIAVASNRPALFDQLCNLGLKEGDRLNRPPPLPRTEMLTIWREK